MAASGGRAVNGAAVSVQIARHPEDVFAVIADVERNARWSSASVEGHLITPGPVRVGSRASEVSRLAGRRIEVVSEVVEFVPGRRLAYVTSGGPFPFAGAFTTEPYDAGTRLTASFEVGLRGPVRIGGGLLRLLVRRQLASDLERLRRLMETGEL